MKEYRIFKDNDNIHLWCAINEEFINVRESPAGFGLTPGFALKELIEQEEELENDSRNNL
jgi:hypothetical protein